MAYLSNQYDADGLLIPLLSKSIDSEDQLPLIDHGPKLAEALSFTVNQNVEAQIQQALEYTLFDMMDFESSSKQDPADFYISYDGSFKDEFFKTQSRRQPSSEQRVKDGVVSFSLHFREERVYSEVKGISVMVARLKELPHSSIGQVPLKSTFENVDEELKIKVITDLDSVYKWHGRLVYELPKSCSSEMKLFNLIIDVSYADGTCCCLRSKNFKITGKDVSQRKASQGVKRRRVHSEISGSHTEGFSGSSSDLSLYSPLSSSIEDVQFMVSRVSSFDEINAQKLVVQELETKLLRLDGELIGRIVVNGGDIAYHFQIKNPDDQPVFSEGEIIGFSTDAKSGQARITKLTLATAAETFLHGVVTRSQYLEAQFPGSDRVQTETVCMLGIVPVRIAGSCEPREALYASPDEPGVAIPEHDLYNVFRREQQSALIGYAFERKLSKEVGLARAAVSILSSAGHAILESRLADMGKKWRKQRLHTNTCCAVGVVFLLALAILLWQLFCPGSALRYMICRRGSVPGQSVVFYFIGERDPAAGLLRVNGIEFEFHRLLKKLSLTNIDPLEGDGYRYFLNIDRCAYGDLRATADVILNMKEVDGPTMFAVDRNCTGAWYYNDPDHWVKYKSATPDRVFCYGPRS